MVFVFVFLVLGNATFFLQTRAVDFSNIYSILFFSVVVNSREHIQYFNIGTSGLRLVNTGTCCFRVTPTNQTTTQNILIIEYWCKCVLVCCVCVHVCARAH